MRRCPFFFERGGKWKSSREQKGAISAHHVFVCCCERRSVAECNSGDAAGCFDERCQLTKINYCIFGVLHPRVVLIKNMRKFSYDENSALSFSSLALGDILLKVASCSLLLFPFFFSKISAVKKCADNENYAYIEVARFDANLVFIPHHGIYSA